MIEQPTPADRSPRRKVRALLLWGATIVATAGVTALATAYVCIQQVPPFSKFERLVRKFQPSDPRKNVNWVALSRINNPKPLRSAVTLTGDSNIQYGPWADVLRQPVDNHGVAGDTTRGLLLRLREGETAGPTVGIMIGINDVAAGIPLAETKANYRAILQHFGNRRIVAISPVVTTIRERNDRIVAIRDAERELCAKVSNCTFVDISRAFEEHGVLRAAYNVDTVHLSWPAYQKLGSILEPVLFEKR